MKKLVMVVVMIMAMVFIGNAFAYEGEQAEHDLDEFLREYDLFDLYTGFLVDNRYISCGTASINSLEKALGDCGDWNDVESWFAGVYSKALMKNFPEYGNVNVRFEYLTKHNETKLYWLYVIAENDLVDIKDGIQNEVEMIVAIY